MARMVRKQIYIEAGQQLALARTARLQGTSEAAVIRQALELAARSGPRRAAPDSGAWQEALDVMRSLKRRGPRRARRDWGRDELYAERLKRYERRSG
jgi:hypothetical protein